MTQDAGGHIAPRARDLGEFAFTVKDAADLADAERAMCHALFQLAYRRANAPYLDIALRKLRYVAIAMHGDTPAGFACGESRVMDLPRLPAQLTTLAGICCIDPHFRRRGLFGRLEGLALAQGMPPDAGQRSMLRCGRMAHPASLRVMRLGAGVVPSPDVPPTSWQREVGAAVAAAYGSDFDPETFVCRGSGTPIGYADVEIDATPEEWAMFAHVDRDRGDSLLGLSWSPAPPRGWLAGS